MDTAEQLECNVKSLRDDAVQLAQALRDGEEFYTDEDDNEIYAHEVFLEVVNEPGKHFALVKGVGGPHTEIEWDGERAFARGYWGSDFASELIDQETADTLFGYFFDY